LRLGVSFEEEFLEKEGIRRGSRNYDKKGVRKRERKKEENNIPLGRDFLGLTVYGGTLYSAIAPITTAPKRGEEGF